ncbi:MAG: glycosyltransferase [Reichenbachiella sp.]|uniref:glycosyltransferase n=1 Tax=Reichenbachiella sp. TaxID=2184521 RepID=UPI00296620FE|nr:glycosyltransferase [Reichenbachiella sp.]MDW3208239.1 glycosyltransferase [Reichenbachiella sp.]
MRTNILVYPGLKYLPRSCTFIYRQLLGVSEQFIPHVIYSHEENMDIFPLKTVVKRKRPLIEKVKNRLFSESGWNISYLSCYEEKFIEDYIKKNNIKLIHAHFGHHGIKMLPIARKLNIPLIVTLHGMDITVYTKNKAYVKALGKLAEYALIICVSKNIQRRLSLLSIKPNKDILHYIGIPIEKFSYVKRTPLKIKMERGDKIVFCQVSRLEEKKGIKYSLLAFAEVLKFYPNSEYRIAGDGTLLSELRKFTKTLQISHKVKFLGSVTSDEVVELFAKSDVFLHHSITAKNGDQEGLPTVIGEAMSTGLIVLSTNHSGIPDLIRDGQDGFLVDEKDVDTYVERLKSALNLSDFSMNVVAKERVDDFFNLKKQNQLLSEIYLAEISEYRGMK